VDAEALVERGTLRVAGGFATDAEDPGDWLVRDRGPVLINRVRGPSGELVAVGVSVGFRRASVACEREEPGDGDDRGPGRADMRAGEALAGRVCSRP
jgi:hypothetical protein